MAAPGAPERAPRGQQGLATEDLPANAPEGETAGAAPHDSGRTTTTRNEQASHRLPHERDESTSTPAGPSGVGRQAHADAESGRVDTSRSEATDETYAREFRADPTTPPDRQAPPGRRR